MGLESAIYTTAEIRALTANEYSLVFDSFPGLYELAKREMAESQVNGANAGAG